MTDDAPELLVREDVSGVQALHGYTSRTCPMKVALDAAPPAGALRRAPTPARLARQEAGRAFEDEVFELLVASHPDAVELREVTDRDDTMAQTIAALQAGAPMVLAGWLPDDTDQHRSGRPDVLLRGRKRGDGRWGYLPVDVKSHKTLAAPSSTTCPGYLSSLGDIATHPTDLTEAVDEPARWSAKIADDLVQLAHYWRMLQALGSQDDSGGAWAGVIGSERVCTWHRLDDEGPTCTSWRTVTGRWTNLEAYDHEFGFRLDILARVQDGRDPGVVPAYTPRWCDECEWWPHCESRMVAADEVTLLPRIDWNRRMRLHAAGLTTRAQIAALDLEAAALADLDAPDQAIAAGDSAGLDGPTVDVVAELGSFPGLAGLVQQARADLTGDALLRDGVDQLVVPRADVEVDLDLESYGGEVYMWGMRIHDPHGLTGEAGTRYLIDEMAGLSADFDPAAVFLRAWQQIADMRCKVEDAGATWAIYSWSGIETWMLRRYAEHLPQPSDVEELVTDADVWVDLMQVVKQQLVLPLRGRYGLKQVASQVAGFRGWDEVKARHGLRALDGEESMLLFAAAVGMDGAPDPGAAEALLAYNRADVDATWTVREWLSGRDLSARGP